MTKLQKEQAREKIRKLAEFINAKVTFKRGRYKRIIIIFSKPVFLHNMFGELFKAFHENHPFEKKSYEGAINLLENYISCPKAEAEAIKNGTWKFVQRKDIKKAKNKK